MTVRWAWLVVAVAAEVASMVTFARLQRTMLIAGGVRVSLRRAVAVALAGNAMSVTLPGGSLLSTAYTVKRMRRWGASPALIAFDLAAAAGLSSLALSAVAVAAVALDHGSGGPWTFAPAAALVVAAVISLRALRRRPQILLRPATAVLRLVNRLRRRAADHGVPAVRSMVAELARIRPGPAVWFRGFWFAFVNWSADIACLVFACRAVGAHSLTTTAVVVSYAAGMAGASVPLIPGGLGIVDGALVLGLCRGGLSAHAATESVVLYRLISFVLVVIIGWVIWWTQRRSVAAT